MDVTNVGIGEIYPDPAQPRKFFDPEALDRLANSIKEVGIEHPIIVRKNGKGYVIIEGERRWRSAKKCGLTTIPCIVSVAENEGDIIEVQLRSDCLKENLSEDELDTAIYRYWEKVKKSPEGFAAPGSSKKDNRGGHNDEGQEYVANSIGLPRKRVQDAIDRVQFKQTQKDFVEKVKKEAAKAYKDKPAQADQKVDNHINRAISQTAPLKALPEVRQQVMEEILKERVKPQDQRNWGKLDLRDEASTKVEEVKKLSDGLAKVGKQITKEDVKQVFAPKKKSIQLSYEEDFNTLLQWMNDFRSKEYTKYPEQWEIDNLIEVIDEFSNELKVARENI